MGAALRKMRQEPVQFMAPTRYPNLWFWIDPHREGSNQGQDQHSTANHFDDGVLDINQTPLYVAATHVDAINGHAVVEFDGGDDEWECDDSEFGDWKRSDAWAVFVVGEFEDDDVAQETFFSKYDGGAAVGIILRFSEVNNRFEWLIQNAAGNRIITRFSVALAMPGIVVGVYDGSETAAGTNLLQNNVAPARTTTADTLSLGITHNEPAIIGTWSNTAHSDPLAGGLATIFAYLIPGSGGTHMDDTQVYRLTKWLSAKYGIDITAGVVTL